MRSFRRTELRLTTLVGIVSRPASARGARHLDIVRDVDAPNLIVLVAMRAVGGDIGGGTARSLREGVTRITDVNLLTRAVGAVIPFPGIWKALLGKRGEGR